MRVLAFLLFFQSFAACQQGSDSTISMEAGIRSSFAARRQSPAIVLPSTANKVLQSTDGGKTWKGIGAGLPDDYNTSDIFVNRDQVYLVSENGLYRGNAGNTAPFWEKPVFLEEKIIGIFPGRNGAYALSLWNGLYQETLPGIWAPVHTSLKDKEIRTILETADGTVFVGSDYGIFKSADNGQTWKKVFSNGIVLNIVESDGVLVAGGFKGLLRSTDGGENWDWVLTEGGVGIQTERIEGGIAAITYNTKTERRRMRTSADNGKTWQPIDADLAPSPFISNIKQVGEYLFCSHPAGIFRSSNQGKTWELMLPAAKETKFNFAVSGNVIYAVVGELGC